MKPYSTHLGIIVLAVLKYALSEKNIFNTFLARHWKKMPGRFSKTTHLKDNWQVFFTTSAE